MLRSHFPHCFFHRGRWAGLCLVPLLLITALTSTVSAQTPATDGGQVTRGEDDFDAYRDADAREMVRLARLRREVVDNRITAYETIAHERVSVRVGVASVDRLLMRRESISRLQWSRDTVRIELLGAREVQPPISSAVQIPPPDLAATLPVLAFDPVGSEMLLRLDSTNLQHPLTEGSESSYRFASGETTTLRLPDGRDVRLRELRVTARRPDPQLINGSLWLEQDSHALVRMAFRVSGPMGTSGGAAFLLPTAELTVEHVAVEYALWDLQWWLPSTLIASGVATAGGIRLPVSYERSYRDYRVDGDPAGLPAMPDATPIADLCRPPITGSVVVSPTVNPERFDDRWAADWDSISARLARGEPARAGSRDPVAADGTPEAAPAAGGARGARARCERIFLVTRSGTPGELRESPAFGGGVYSDDGPLGVADLAGLQAVIERIPPGVWGLGSPSVRIATPDLLRYNRVEGFSLGVSAMAPFGPGALGAELRVGTTGEVGGRLTGRLDGPRRLAELGLYREVSPVDPPANPHSLATTVGAALFGRDDNDYFRATGVELRFSPSPARAQRWDARMFAERQAPLEARSGGGLRGALDDDFQPRRNLAAERLDQLGLLTRLRAAAGDDPARFRSFAELSLHMETGTASFLRPSFLAGADRGITRRIGIAALVNGGTGFGELPPQRNWQIGGATTVRGHDGAAMRGDTFWTGRGEVNFGLPAARLSLFGDLGWAGTRDDLFGPARPIAGAGIGISLIDNLVRIDAARGIRGGGTRLYLRLGQIL